LSVFPDRVAMYWMMRMMRIAGGPQFTHIMNCSMIFKTSITDLTSSCASREGEVLSLVMAVQFNRHGRAICGAKFA